jgi:hypothetical protein
MDSSHTYQGRRQDFLKVGSYYRKLYRFFMTMPTNFDAATPIIGCALSRIVHALPFLDFRYAATDELANDF